MSATGPGRGEVWHVDLNPTRGHEQSGERPCLVVSAELYNEGAAGLVVVLPLTTKFKRIPWQVPVRPPEGGLKALSYIKCDDIRSVAKERMSRRWGAVSEGTMTQVEDRLRTLLVL